MLSDCGVLWLESHFARLVAIFFSTMGSSESEFDSGDYESGSESESLDSSCSSSMSEASMVVRKRHAGKKPVKKGKKPQAPKKGKSRDRKKDAKKGKSRDRAPKRKHEDSSEAASSDCAADSDAASEASVPRASPEGLNGLDAVLQTSRDAAAPSGRMMQLAAVFQAMASTQEKTGPNISDVLASYLGPTFRVEPGQAYVKELLDMYPRPGNLPTTQVPATNKAIESNLPAGHGILDKRLILTQQLLSSLAGVLIRMLDDVSHTATEKKPIEDYQPMLRDAVRMNVFAFTSLLQCRKDIWNGVGYPTSLLCTWEEPVGLEELFDGNINKRIKQIQAERQLLKKQRCVLCSVI